MTDLRPIALRYDSGRSARPNTFNAEYLSPLYRIEMFVRTTDAAIVHHVECWVQVQARGDARRRDPCGHPALLVTRTGEGEWTIESCRLHMDLPRVAYALIGWTP